MKFLTPFLSFLVICSFAFSSCSDEEIFNDFIAENTRQEDDIDEDQGEDENADSSDEPDDSLGKISQTPCDFSLDNVQANSTIVINCKMDLEGKTVDLPSNIILDFDGGEIINGTINFSNDSTIDGRLLNSTLTLGGVNPQLKSSTFNFYKDRWGIIEGVVSDNIASTNTTIINQTINLITELGGNTFSIDKMDAYFGINTESRKPHAIFIPSNFNFIMTDNTNLRVQPNGLDFYALLFSWGEDNILISGGKLWGDRYAHDYDTDPGTHEWGHIVSFKAVHNAVVDNVEMHEGTGDGFYLSGASDRNADGSLKPNRRESVNITVKNCLLNYNRRNNISIVDGRDIFIEYNTISNAGNNDSSSSFNSNSVSPQVAVIIESREQVTADGNSLNRWEKTENVHIRNNNFEDNRADVVLLSGEKAFIYENTFTSKNSVTVSAAVDGKIYNNKFERSEGLMSSAFGLKLEGRYFANGEDRVKNYEVTNNTFTGYQFAILAQGQGHIISDNTITNCERGINLGASKDIEFNNNIISSNIEGSYGYFAFSHEKSIQNCLIKNGEINVLDTSLFFSNINNDEEGDITIDNVDFNGRIRLEAVQGVTIRNSKFNDTKFVDCNPILINNN